MTTFQVADMTCGHCTSAISKAVKGVDAAASVSFDLSTHRVAIESTFADATTLSAAVTAAGYTPVPLAHASDSPRVSAAKNGGCCCGQK